MSDHDNRHDGGLVPAGRHDLAPVAPANPLVSRGLADIARINSSIKTATTLATPCKIKIDIPGWFSVYNRGIYFWSWKTPSILGISPEMLRLVYLLGWSKKLSNHKKRLAMLCALKAPEVIIQNTIRMMKRCEEALGEAPIQSPGDCTYGFQWEAESFDCAEFARGLRQLPEFLQWDLLDLSGCPVTDEGLGHLRHVSNLQELCLQNCVRITDDGLAHLASLPRLHELDLAGCPVTDRGLALLSGLRQLRSIALERCPRITPGGLKALQAALPECQVLVS